VGSLVTMSEKTTKISPAFRASRCREVGFHSVKSFCETSSGDQGKRAQPEEEQIKRQAQRYQPSVEAPWPWRPVTSARRRLRSSDRSSRHGLDVRGIAQNKTRPADDEIADNSGVRLLLIPRAQMRTAKGEGGLRALGQKSAGKTEGENRVPEIAAKLGLRRETMSFQPAKAVSVMKKISSASAVGDRPCCMVCRQNAYESAAIRPIFLSPSWMPQARRISAVPAVARSEAGARRRHFAEERVGNRLAPVDQRRLGVSAARG